MYDVDTIASSEGLVCFEEYNMMHPDPDPIDSDEDVYDCIVPSAIMSGQADQDCDMAGGVQSGGIMSFQADQDDNMSRNDTDYKTYLELVQDCNRVVWNGVDTDMNKSSVENRLVAINELTKILLYDHANPDPKELRVFGYVTKEIREKIKFLEDKFCFTTVQKDKRLDDSPDRNDPDASIYGYRIGDHASINMTLYYMIASKFLPKEFNFLWRHRERLVKEPGRAQPESKRYPHLPMLGGPAEGDRSGVQVRVPWYLTYLLGTVRHEVHLTIYTMNEAKNSPEFIWVRTRAKKHPHTTAKSNIYPGKYEQIVVRPVFFNKDLTQTLEQGINSHPYVMNNRDKIRLHDPVSYFTIAGKEGGEVTGMVNSAIVSCHSFETHKTWQQSEDLACQKYTIKQVKEQLLAGEWEPGSALAMLRFFVDKDIITYEEEGYEEMVQNLGRQLPHWNAMESVPGASNTSRQ